MKSSVHVASPPAKPVIIYDGDCRFCALWIARWRRATGHEVEYQPYQDPGVAAAFPELPLQQLESAVHFIETDGSVYSGAEAAIRALAGNPSHRLWLDWYGRSPLLANGAERAYRFVAGHRLLFSALTRLAWGRHVQPPTHSLVRWVFLRALGAIYLVAFVSLWVQVIGLTGFNGILPAKMTMDALRAQMDAQKLGSERYHLAPTFCWFDSSDRCLKLQCAGGTLLAVLLLFGIAPAPCLFLLWLIYLSLSTVCREFLGFQWDILLLETGFLAIFFAPLQLMPRFTRSGREAGDSAPSRGFLRPDFSGEAPPSRIMLWVLRGLLFLLMFESGCVKLLSHDPMWRNLTALTAHYETQPLPTCIGWYAHQLPLWVQKTSTSIMFGIELVLPFFIFGPRRFRLFACVVFIAFQTLIFLTGNYCFFNLLTIALCLLLADDAALGNVVAFGRRFNLRRAAREELGRVLPPHSGPLPQGEGDSSPALGSVANSQVVANACCSPALPRTLRWPRLITVPLTCVFAAVSLMQFSWTFRQQIEWPAPMIALYSWLQPLRTFNSYGLFAVMTPSRPEIIIEGSNDGVTWLEYEFKYKVGDVRRRPRFVEPHQPRLDWQMWFAALGTYQQNPWFVNFCIRLLQGSPEVLRLLDRNPFPNAPPRYIRAVTYDYRFTTFAQRRQTGAWWRRQWQGIYLQPISLREAQ